MSIDQLLVLANAAGVPGLILAVIVLLFVYVAKWSGLVKDGTWARFANIALALLFAGVEAGNQEAAVTAAIGAILAGLFYEIIEAVQKQIKARQK